MIKVDSKHRRIEASFLDGFLKELAHSLFNGAAGRLEEGAKDVLSWFMARLALNVIALGVTVTAVLLLLVAGIEGLKAASIPPALAYLIAGGVGLITGLLMLRLKK